MHLFHYLKSSPKTIALRLIVAWLFLMPIANTAHSIEHDLFTQEITCHLCNHSSFDDLSVSHTVVTLATFNGSEDLVTEKPALTDRFVFLSFHPRAPPTYLVN